MARFIDFVNKWGRNTVFSRSVDPVTSRTFCIEARMTVSLLLYPDDAPGKWDRDLEEPTEHDTYDQFVIGGQV